MNTTYVKQKTDEIYKEIHDEFVEDFKISLDVLGEKSLQVPSTKHKWVGRFQRAKLDERLLKEELDKRREIEKAELRSNAKVDLSGSDMSKVRISNSTRMEEIENELEIVAFKRSYLEMMVHHMQYNWTKDISNMIEMHKLETQ